MSKVTASISMHARLQNAVAEVELNIVHPQHGNVRGTPGNVTPANFIQLLQVRHNGQDIMEAQWGTSMARDPYLIFYVAGAAAGDVVSVEWHDNKGKTGRHAITL